jgi:hypothetical protein
LSDSQDALRTPIAVNRPLPRAGRRSTYFVVGVCEPEPIFFP